MKHSFLEESLTLIQLLKPDAVFAAFVLFENSQKKVLTSGTIGRSITTTKQEMTAQTQTKALLAKTRISNQTRFDDELKGFLYGFAGDSDPQKDTVDLLNDLTVDYVAKVTAEAANLARTIGMPFDCEALLFTVRNDLRKRERANELLEVYEEIKRLRTNVSKDVTNNVKRPERVTTTEGEKAPKKKATPVPASSAGATATTAAADGSTAAAPKRKKKKAPTPATGATGAAGGSLSSIAASSVVATTAAATSNAAAAPAQSDNQQTEFML